MAKKKQVSMQGIARKLNPALNPTPQEQAAYELATFRAARKSRTDQRRKGRA